MRRPEQQLQISVAAFLRVALRPPTIWTAFPAGGGGRVRGAFLKAMGLQAGWPDLIVMHPAAKNTLVVGFELKSKDGTQSVAQNYVDGAFYYCRAKYFIARSVDEVEGFLRGVGIPLYATTSKELQGKALALVSVRSHSVKVSA